MNVKDSQERDPELGDRAESPIDLGENGWTRDTLQPGDAIVVDGWAARNGSRQAWGNSVAVKATGRKVMTFVPKVPPPLLQTRPTPRWPDKQPRLGAPSAGSAEGYWAFPSQTALVENGVTTPMDQWGLLKNIADAPKVAPLQPWAQALYIERQRRFLRTTRCF